MYTFFLTSTLGFVYRKSGEEQEYLLEPGQDLRRPTHRVRKLARAFEFNSMRDLDVISPATTIVALDSGGLYG